MVDPREFLEAALKLHGHKCPAMSLGLRAGAIAMNRLGIERSQDKNLLALVELGDDHCSHCMGDGAQMITGCTFGEGNIKQLGYGKFGLTLVDRATNRAVRAVPLAEAQVLIKRTPFFQDYRVKGVPASRVPDEIVDPLIGRVFDIPEAGLFKVSEVFAHEAPATPENFHWFMCSRCSDMVVEPYGRIVGTHSVCLPCAEDLRAEELRAAQAKPARAAA